MRNIELVNNTGGSISDLLKGSGGAISVESSSNVLVEHNSMAGLTLEGATSGITIRDDQLTGAGVVIADATTGLLVTGNTLQSVAVNDIAQGTITNNTINGGGIVITATFTGSIDHNLIQGAEYGVALFASAPLNSNRIFNNAIGIVDFVNSLTTGLGFLTGATPNLIIGNDTGVQLNGVMQGQIISSNGLGLSPGVGVIGVGVLGGASLDSANLIVNNAMGVSFSGEVRFNRIGRNQHSIVPQNGQLIDHNVFFDNNTANLETQGTQGVQIVDNSFYSTSQNNVMIDGGSSDIQVLNNVMWAKAEYDLDIADNSRSGFFSDYNDLYTTGSGKIVHYLVDFTDILDWQDAFNRFDLHSIGTTVVNPTGAAAVCRCVAWRLPRVFSSRRTALDQPDGRDRRSGAGYRAARLLSESAYQSLVRVRRHRLERKCRRWDAVVQSGGVRWVELFLLGCGRVGICAADDHPQQHDEHGSDLRRASDRPPRIPPIRARLS